MEDKVYLIYDNNNAEIDFPIDYEDLFECFKTKFNVDGEKEDYIFKTKDENGDEEIIDDKVEIEYFKKDMKIYVTKNLDETKNFSMQISQFVPNKKKKEMKNEKEKETSNENRIEEIILFKNEDDIKSKEDLENEYNNFIDKNKNKITELTDIKTKNKNLQNELKKLKEELENIKKKPKKKKFNVTNYEIEIKRLTDIYENKKNKLEEEISQLKKTNKQKQNELEQLKLSNEQEDELKSNLHNEQSELIIRKNNMLSQAFDKKNIINKTTNPNFNNKKKNSRKEFLLNYFRKSLEPNKKNKIENDKANIQIEEEKRRNAAIEMFKTKIRIFKAKKKERKSNKNIKGNGAEENENLRNKKIELDDMLKELNKKLENLQIENQSEITKLLNEKKMDKKRREEENQRKKIEEENERKKEEEKQRKIKEEEEKQRKIKEEEEKQRKIEEEKNRKIKEEKEKQRKIEEEKKKNDMKNQKQKEIINKKDKDKNKLKENELIDKEEIQRLIRNGTLKNIHYSYECTNVMTLQQYVYQGSESAEIPVILKNTGPFSWPPNTTKLIFDKNFRIKGKTIVLNSLDKNQEQKYIVKVDGLSNLPLGEYEAGVYLNINGNNIGKIIKMKVIIKEKEIDPIEKNKEIIKQFRNEYNLFDENEYQDEDLYDLLLSNNFKFDKAFMCLIGDGGN